MSQLKLNLSERDTANQKALDNPQPGDYWQEMFCPYFIVVEADNKNDKYTVLSCMGGPDSFNRKDEPNARKDIDGATWCFDFGKSMTVNRAWIERAVKYDSIDGFVADVVQSEKTESIVQGWREFKRLDLRRRIDELEEEYEKYTGWKYLKEGIK